MSTRAGCAWTAQSDVLWITITKGWDGKGRGSVAYQVEPQSNPADRVGSIVLGKYQHRIVQRGPSEGGGGQ
ncbi:MAG: BACON domain-containing protein [Candidatus Competibacteraceae bacterium]|nr:BACON domain-containing protein [Candidatus Competibacteraceae bacterium]